MFFCKFSFWYSRERARQKNAKIYKKNAKKFANFANFANPNPLTVQPRWPPTGRCRSSSTRCRSCWTDAIHDRIGRGAYACAKRRSIGQMQISAELQNVGEASDPFERGAHGRVPAAFLKNPEKIWLNLVKIQQSSRKICEFLGKNSKKFSNF